MTDETKEQLDVLNQQKEDAFQKKQVLSNQIAEKIAIIGKHRQDRNTLTQQVRSLKKDRDKLNAQITEKIAEIKAARPMKKVELPKDARGRVIRPAMLKARIDQLETKLETEPMSFQAEQKLTKEVKDLLRQYNEIRQASGLSGELKEKSILIDTLKHDANELHARVTEMAKQSQQHHETMLQLSKEIDELKKAEEIAYQEFLTHKEAYVKIAGDVKAEQTAVRRQKKSRASAEKKRKDAEDQKTLQERAKEAEKKMKKGSKLTTEDLLALQSLKE